MKRDRNTQHVIKEMYKAILVVLIQNVEGNHVSCRMEESHFCLLLITYNLLQKNVHSIYQICIVVLHTEINVSKSD